MAPARSTSAAAPWGGCGCSASGSARTERSPAPTSTRRCCRPPTPSSPSEGLGNVALVEDDLFASDLEPASFDLVHARFQLGPLARGDEQMGTYLRLVRPGGTVVLEDVDPASLHFLPPAPALEERLIPFLKQAFAAAGDPQPGITQLRLFRDVDIDPTVRAEVQALPPGHPYLLLPLQFASALDGLLRTLVDADELAQVLDEAETELADPGRWGLTFTLVQAWGQRTP